MAAVAEPSSRPADAPTRFGSAALATIAFLWPLIYFHELYAHGAKSLALGNDFGVNYYQHKVYLLDALSRGTLPLWSPSEAGGFPFMANPFAQVFYPGNLPLAWFYTLAGGYSAVDHQAFTVLGSGLFSLGTFLWLRAVGAAPRHALFAACVVSISFRIGEIFRFPNAVHTAAWLPWVLWASTRCFQAVTRARIVWYGLCAATALLLMLTGAYVYYVYYAAFLFAPYGLVLLRSSGRVWIGARSEFLGLKVLTLAGAVGAAALVTLPYYVRVYQLLAQIESRGGNDLEYATAHAFGPLDTLGSLVYPLAAQPAGCFYLGVLPLLLVGLYLTSVSPWRSAETKLAWLLVLWIAVLTYVTYGRSSYLFSFLWEVVPGTSRLRVWGRMNIVLLPLFAWLLAAAVRAFEERLAMAQHVSRTVRTALPVLGVYLPVLLAQLALLWAGTAHADWGLPALSRVRASVLNAVPAGSVGVIVLVALLSLPRLRGAALRHRSILVIALLVATVLDLRNVTVGLWTEPKNPPASERKVLRIDQRNAEAPRTPRSPLPLGAYRTLSHTAEFNLSVLYDWYFERYVGFLYRSCAEPAARDRLLGRVDGTRVYLTPRIDYGSIASFLDEAEPLGGVVSYDGDRLELDVSADRAGYVSFIDNWDPQWRARIDGEPAPLERLFGTFKSVAVPAGSHRVEFSYEPSWLSFAAVPSPLPRPDMIPALLVFCSEPEA